jgi:hypothetical protein
VLRCVECETKSTGKGLDWRAVLSGEPGETEYVNIYCPTCAEREFGPRRPRDHQST